MRRPQLLAPVCALVAAMLIGAAPECEGAVDDIDAALDLADAAPATPVAAPRSWKLNVEAAAVSAVSQNDAAGIRSQLAMDAQINHRVARSLQAVLAGRVDYFDSSLSVERHSTVSTLKEAYLSWQPTPMRIVDVGRVNLRFGVAMGYNPTDFFKAGAVQITTTPDPESRRKNRLGSVMLRGQQLWESGALSVQLSPRLADQRDPGDPAASGALDRTNSTDRWLLSGSHQVNGNVRPQWLVYGERGHAPQFGLNLSTLLSDSAVAYAEWAGGRSASLAALAAGRNDDHAFRSRTALGVTYTLPIDLSLTLELQANGAGVSAAQAQTLAASDPLAWGRTLRWAGALQESATRHTLFAHVRWRNMFVQKLDLTGFAQADTDDGGRQYWLELRRRFDSFDLSLQWQRQTGDAWTRFGALPEQRSTRLLANFYF